MSAKKDRLWELAPPIRSPYNQVFHFEDKELYHVGRIIAEINANPEQFQFAVVHLAQFAEQIRGQGNLDQNYIASISPVDATRPVLIGRYSDGAARLIDGYHRAARCMQLGWDALGAWILTPEQTASIMLMNPQWNKLQQE